MLNKEKVIFEEESYDFEIEDRSSEFIASALNALTAVDLLDTGLMNENDKEVVNNIRYQAINIISESLNNIFNEVFDTTADSSNDLVV
jgi:hypothetical protein